MALRIFSDVEIDIENTIGTGVFLLIKVKNNPRLDKTSSQERMNQ